ncbi:uncharacterized protein CMU_039140 [Cryptosporidium muris RN66]|uniref:PLOD1-3-like GT domain-containing protein n=1 Tax=Cryptosporidium muris (strain RN66) TaxID=441375 RepID=B6A9F6_CRYMR|nr:uncharacterized protein CMU_039140 [Cryptosporidium muris RN66]EEA04847.1 hypothetical protein, conserved [Cryptosporidium muris RN66]|eukprot:XP_002139196.1 hypothetical protein [Cryptosporidium muris RN66]
MNDRSLSVEGADELVSKLPGMKGRRLHVLTPATHCEMYFPALLVSAQKLGYRLHILGLGEKWQNFRWKLVKVREFCKTLPPNDLVLHVDAFDVCFLQPPHILVERYLMTGVDILSCGEQPSSQFLLDAFHDSMFRADLDVSWPDRREDSPEKLDLRYLNSGNWITTAKLAIRMLSIMPENEVNDQKWLSKLYLISKGKFRDEETKKAIIESCGLTEMDSINIDIDYRCQLFYLSRDLDGSCLDIIPHDIAGKKYCSWFKKNSNGEAATPEAEQEYSKTYLNGILIDKDAESAPCVLHMYCRANHDEIVKKLGLPIAIPEISSIIYYAYYSFIGSWRVRRYISMILATAVGALSLLAIFLYLFTTSKNYLMSFSTNMLSKPIENISSFNEQIPNSFLLCEYKHKDSKLEDLKSLESAIVLGHLRCTMNSHDIPELTENSHLIGLIPPDLEIVAFSRPHFQGNRYSPRTSDSTKEQSLNSYTAVTFPFIPKSIQLKDSRCNKDSAATGGSIDLDQLPDHITEL